MIQLVMIFGLGFLMASLLALFMLPIVSRRAVRLVTRRLEMRVPLSMNEIVAERDQIRADHAASTRRLEQRIDTLGRHKAELMTESGRQATRVVDLQQDLATMRAKSEQLATDLDGATRDALEAQGTLGTQNQLLHNTMELAERRLEILRAAEARLASIEMLAEERRASIAALETRSTGQDLRIRLALTQAAKAADDLARAQASIAALGVERDVMRAEATAMLELYEGLQAQVEAERERVLAGEKRYAGQAEQLAGLAGRVAEQAADIASLQRSLTAANSKRDALQVERDRLVQAADNVTRTLADRDRQIKALEASRATIDEPQSSGRPATAQDDELIVLRAAISSVAADLLRLHDIPASAASPRENGPLPILGLLHGTQTEAAGSA